MPSRRRRPRRSDTSMACAQLSDGRVIVNDAGRRRVLMFDKALTTVERHRRHHARPKDQYGARASAIVEYAGDYDPVRRHHRARIPRPRWIRIVTRAMSAPRPNDVATMANASFGAPRVRQIGPADLSKLLSFHHSERQSPERHTHLQSCPIRRRSSGRTSTRAPPTRSRGFVFR